jgi:S1-C subfamily serine protease
MNHQILSHYSDALADRALAAAAQVVAVRGEDWRHISGLIWQADLVVTSEQSLIAQREFEVVLPGGRVTKARVAGRDPGTNIALLRLAEPVPAPPYSAASAKTGALALAYGSNGEGGLTARSGAIQESGPAWSSRQGGHIDGRLVLDIRLSRREEGGPVFDAHGGFIGMSTFGIRGQILVIPSETLSRVVPLLARDGRIARGWLGVKLQPVAVPDTLQVEAGQTSALMAMSVVENSPAAKAGLLAGDIILSIGQASAHRIRHVAAQLGPDSIGRTVDIRAIRAGTIQQMPLTVAEQPSA